jgi:hypothetical protein
LAVEDVEKTAVPIQKQEQSLIAVRKKVDRIEETINEDPREQDESNRVIVG